MAQTELEAAFEGRFAVPGVRWGIAVGDLSVTARSGMHAPDRELSVASVGKILLLVYAAVMLDAGDAAVDEPLDRRSVDAVADSGLWQHLAVDELPLGDVARLVGIASDNWATNVLLERVGGVGAVMATAEALGIRNLLLHDRVRDVRGPDDPPVLATATAGGLADLMRRLVRDEGMPPGVSERVLGWLRGGHDLSMVAAPLGLDPLAHSEPDRGLSVVNKTGTDRGVRADVGYIEGPAGGVVYACIANWDAPEDGLDPVRDEVLDAMHEVGRMIRRRVLGK